ncbi:Crp/Fnr family transcriptional regulator (plasmid) [Bradyrhizobium sp. CB82]|uniref:Crp/Fnr family transcriptional regulator n=1 Tax=Bradyrhizobium sp. CB82 TaxID=3039159 RepID=UPI0024B0E452|nr:Crp/Fnr family transcriptional regulator [Bradyrhizobium sp. CB82]WFU45446.1 Crp/Fnr family transcriptional regulator [Bradyrhizobium sp. CB82]
MPHQKLIARLQATGGLSDEERRSLADMPRTIRSLADGEYFSREGDVASHCAILVSGFLCRHKIVETRDQILSFHVPGDMPDLNTLHLPEMDHDLISIGRSTVALLPHRFLSQMLDGSPRLTHAFWRETLIDAAIYRQWVANLGGHDAIAKIAHLICELLARLEAVSLAQDNKFQLPFTQKHLADACGISIVHVNRTLQELRRRSLIVWEGGEVAVLNREELERIAEFVPDYLHLKR